MLSVIRRYTPPTCTLEIKVKNSPLSRWLRRPSLKQLRFELRFDDPRKAQDKPVIISGDRAQLEQLADAVNTYVQEFLVLPATSLSLTAGSAKASSSSNFQEISAASTSTPSLKPRGLVAHDLFFGSLATETSGQVIKLSALQLFDLATALDECTADMTTLPEGAPSSAQAASSGSLGDRWRTLKTVPVWSGAFALASVLLMAIGIIVLGVGIIKQRSIQTSPLASNQEPDSNSKQRKTVDVLPPVAPKSSNEAKPSLKVPSSLSSQENLPPPPPVEPPQLSTRITDKSERQDISVTPNSPKKTSPSLSPLANSAPASSKTRSSSPSSSKITTNLPSLPPLLPESSTSTSLEKREQARVPNVSDSLASPDLNQSQSNSTTALNNIPQLVEVQQYLQQQWNPPEDLSRTLQYRLIFNPNGSIERIIPLGDASKIYLDRTGIPLKGEQFVSILEKKQQLKIRVLLAPDGIVQTFLE